MLLIEDRLAAAREHIAAGRRDSAGLVLESIIDINPGHPEALRHLAETRLAQGKVAEALKLATAAAQREPSGIEGLALLATIALVAGDAEIATAAIDQGMAIDPANAGICAIKADRLTASRDFAAAEKLLIAALARHPEDARLLSTLAQLYATSGAAAPALDYGQRALAADPDNPVLLARLGLQLAGLGDHAHAVPYLERAYLLNPGDLIVWVQLSDSLLACGAVSEAHRLAQRMIGLYPNFLPGWENWVRGMICRGEAETALGRFARLAQSHSERVPALLALAGCYRAAGRPQQALTLLRPLVGRAGQLPAEHRAKAISLIRDCCLSLGMIDEMRAALPAFDIRAALGLAPDEQTPAAIEAATVVIDGSLSTLEALALLRFVASSDAADPRDIRGAMAIGELVALVPGCRFAADDVPDNATGSDAGSRPIRAFPLSAVLSLPEPPDALDRAIPYVDAPKDRRAIWRRSLRDLPRPLVGIAWDQSRPGLLLDDCRRAIGAFDGTLVGLVWDEGRPQLGAWPEIIDAGVHFSGLADLAAVIAEVDAVIGPDGLPLHIAGAMGRPGILLSQPNPPWYWHASTRGACWYPTIEVLQTDQFGNWAERVDDIAARLGEFLSAMPRTALAKGEHL